MADTIKQEFIDQVLHAIAGFAVVALLTIVIHPAIALGIAMLIMLAREGFQHGSLRLGFGSALDLFSVLLGGIIGALI